MKLLDPPQYCFSEPLPLLLFGSGDVCKTGHALDYITEDKSGLQVITSDMHAAVLPGLSRCLADQKPPGQHASMQGMGYAIVQSLPPSVSAASVALPSYVLYLWTWESCLSNEHKYYEK